MTDAEDDRDCVDEAAQLLGVAPLADPASATIAVAGRDNRHYSWFDLVIAHVKLMRGPRMGQPAPR